MVNLTYSVSLWNYIHYHQIPELGELFASLRRYDYGVELWNSWRGELNLLDASARKEIKPLLGDMPVSLHTEIGLNDKDFHTRQLDAAVDLGAPVLVLHSDNLYINDTKELDVDLTGYVVEYAASLGVQVALENGQLPFLVNAIEQVPDLNICLDVGHVYLTDQPMQAFMDALKDRIIHLHIQEILSKPEMGLLMEGGIIIDHYTPGTGGIPSEDWTLLFETLNQVNYEGLAVFEIQPRKPLQTAFLGTQFINQFLK